MMRSRFLLVCMLALGAGGASAQGILALAEQPVRLVRGAALYKAASGVALQKDDILETGDAGAQVEAGLRTIVALGPHTRVLVASLAVDDKSSTELSLLEGWIKVLAKTGKRAFVATPDLQVTLASGSTIVHAGEGADSVFAEEGEQQVARADGKAGAPLKLAAEQYATLDPAKPQPVAGRPPRAFVSSMPPSFRDALAPAPAVRNAGKVPPVKERDADYADVGPWLAAPLPARKSFVARFRPRLADPAFRKALEKALGESADWKNVLQPARQGTPQQAPARASEPGLF
jgi:hypothetical protein